MARNDSRAQPGGTHGGVCLPMKAVAVFPGSQQVKIIEQDVPRLTKPDQVALRLLDVGICGTDKEICSFEYGTPPPGDDHLVIGHESLAEIVQVGSAVERFEVGDLVVPSVRRPCPHPGCLACRSGHQDYCYTGGWNRPTARPGWRCSARTCSNWP